MVCLFVRPPHPNKQTNKPYLCLKKKRGTKVGGTQHLDCFASKLENHFESPLGFVALSLIRDGTQHTCKGGLSPNYLGYLLGLYAEISAPSRNL